MTTRATHDTADRAATDASPATSGAALATGPFGSIRERIHTGQLGAWPVIAGLVLVWIIFESINPVFLTSRNLVQLLTQLSPVGVIALGVVFTLLVGQIDLSVGSTSGVAAAITAILFINLGWPVALAIIVAALFGVALGVIYSVAFNRFGIPSFVATMAGLLTLLGVQLMFLGNAGAVNIPFDSFLGRFGNGLYVPAWLSYVIVVAVAVAMFASGYSLRRTEIQAGAPARSTRTLLTRSIVVMILLGVAAWYLNLDRGVAWLFVFFVVLVVAADYVLQRTKWGRSVYAVGGNAEAARRVGIKVERVYLSAFVICSTLSAIGGVLFAAYNVSASNQTGTGDVNLSAIAAAVIGGASLFGGRGRAYAALLGMFVIQSISNGLALISPQSDILYIVTGFVLLVSVGLDSFARRTQRVSGTG